MAKRSDSKSPSKSFEEDSKDYSLSPRVRTRSPNGSIHSEDQQDQANSSRVGTDHSTERSPSLNTSPGRRVANLVKGYALKLKETLSPSEKKYGQLKSSESSSCLISNIAEQISELRVSDYSNSPSGLSGVSPRGASRVVSPGGASRVVSPGRVSRGVSPGGPSRGVSPGGASGGARPRDRVSRRSTSSRSPKHSGSHRHQGRYKPLSPDYSCGGEESSSRWSSREERFSNPRDCNISDGGTTDSALDSPRSYGPIFSKPKVLVGSGDSAYLCHNISIPECNSRCTTNFKSCQSNGCFYELEKECLDCCNGCLRHCYVHCLATCSSHCIKHENLDDSDDSCKVPERQKRPY